MPVAWYNLNMLYTSFYIIYMLRENIIKLCNSKRVSRDWQTVQTCPNVLVSNDDLHSHHFPWLLSAHSRASLTYTRRMRKRTYTHIHTQTSTWITHTSLIILFKRAVWHNTRYSCDKLMILARWCSEPKNARQEKVACTVYNVHFTICSIDVCWNGRRRINNEMTCVLGKRENILFLFRFESAWQLTDTRSNSRNMNIYKAMRY